MELEVGVHQPLGPKIHNLFVKYFFLDIENVNINTEYTWWKQFVFGVIYVYVLQSGHYVDSQIFKN